jgi:hypothetical protein
VSFKDNDNLKTSKKYLIGWICLILVNSVSAQVAFPIQWKQIKAAPSSGYYLTSTSGGIGNWTTDNTVKWPDTTNKIATKYDLLQSGMNVPGSDKQVIFNNGGHLGASANFLYNTTLSSFAIGTFNTLGGSATTSMAVGQSNTISASSSIAFGSNMNIASGASNSLGFGTFHTVNSINSGAFGVGNTHQSVAQSSYSFGTALTIYGPYSSVFGRSLIARAFNETVFGQYNVDESGATAGTYVSTDPLIVAGNGTSSGARSNAWRLAKNGNTEFAGSIKSISGGFVFPDGTVQTTAATGSGGADGNNYLSGTTASLGPVSGTGYDLTFSRVGFSDLVSTIRIPTATSQLTNDAGFLTGTHNHSIGQINYLSDSLLIKQNKFVAGTNLTWNAAHDTLNASLTAAVSSFNGRTGAVVPGSSDYTKTMIGLPNVQNVDQTNAANLTSGSIPTGRYGNNTISIKALKVTGTPDGTKYLAGDSTWKTFAGTSTTVTAFTTGNLWGQMCVISTGGVGTPETGVYEVSISGDNNAAGGNGAATFVILIPYRNYTGTNVVLTSTTVTGGTIRDGSLQNASYSVNVDNGNIIISVNAGSFNIEDVQWSATIVSKTKNLTLL